MGANNSYIARKAVNQEGNNGHSRISKWLIVKQNICLICVETFQVESAFQVQLMN